MHDFGWQCSPVERAGTEAPPYKDDVAAPPAAQPEPASRPIPAAMPAATLTPLSKPVPPRAATPESTGKPAPPQILFTARGDKADNLQQISGIGPKLEKTLHDLGFFHFDQIAGWSRDEVMWVDERLSFKGRIDREEWIPQAKLLAAGDLDQFARKYGTGGLKGKSGKTSSGTHTRRS